MNTPHRSQSSKQDVFAKDTNPPSRSRNDEMGQCVEIHRFPSGVNWHSDCETTCSANAREGTMFKRIGLVVAGLALSASVAAAGSVDRKNLQVFNDISDSVNRYVHFTIFDDVSANVEDGVVTLTGRVTMPYKREDIEKRVARIDGVREVRDQITVLPVSQFDNRLRYQIARAIYGHPNFWNYAIGPNPSIHIIVEHGHVTLTGVVNNDLDRQLARSLVDQFGVMSVTSDLKTEAEARAAIEKS
jgi:hyperosmotically inducible protein